MVQQWPWPFLPRGLRVFSGLTSRFLLYIPESYTFLSKGPNLVQKTCLGRELELKFLEVVSTLPLSFASLAFKPRARRPALLSASGNESLYNGARGHGAWTLTFYPTWWLIALSLLSLFFKASMMFIHGHAILALSRIFSPKASNIKALARGSAPFYRTPHHRCGAAWSLSTGAATVCHRLFWSPLIVTGSLQSHPA